VSTWGQPATGKPAGSRIPIAYVPHPPRQEYYGTSLLDEKLALVREINDQLVNTGDIVSQEAANIPALVNVREPKLIHIGGVRTALDLGFQAGDRIPSIFYPNNRSSNVSEAIDHNHDLRHLVREELFCPRVLFGENDGSQRSAAALTVRAIPLVAHIREERGFYTTGFSDMCKTVLYQAADKGFGNISEREAQEAHIKLNWYPMFPRDALEEVASIISRVQAGTLSVETAISMVGDVLDIKRELSRIESDALRKSESTVKPGTSGELAGLTAKQPIEGVS
jgi:hypothetical protein